MLTITDIIERQKNNYDGYNFPEGKYQVVALVASFPGHFFKKDLDIEIAEEQWLEWLNDEERKKRENQNWFYLKYTQENKDLNCLWLPKEILYDAFDV